MAAMHFLSLPEESAMAWLSSPLARRILGAIGLLTLASPALAQGSGTIRGKVTDASARPLSDVSVSVVGTALGGITSANGDYLIVNVPAGQQQLATRRLGYNRAMKQVEVPAGATATADFTLSVTVTKLQELVVTGTAGTVERRQVGNSITTVDVADLTSKTSISSVSEILQGKTPGVVYMPGSGAVGTAGEIRIRGVGSTNGYKPAVFIDGVRYNIDDVGGYSATGGGTAGLAQSTQITSALNNLNPNDIESIEVIKGPAAATLYGAQAANGVIQIITKSGARGAQQMRWNLRGEMGTSEWHLLPDDNYTFCDAAKQAALIDPANPTLGPLWPGCQNKPVNSVITDNPLKRDPRALRTGDIMKSSLNATGGGDRYNFYFAGDRDLEQGVFYNSDNARTSIRANFGFNPSSRTDFGVRVNWSDGQLRLPIQDESANGILLSARRGEPGRVSRLGPGNEGWRSISPTQANRYKNFTRAERLTLSGTVNYTPFTWFRNRLTTGIDNTSTQAQLLFLPGDIDISQDPDAGSGANLKKIPERKIVTIDYGGTLTYNALANLTSTTSFGSQVVADKSETLEARGIGIGAVDVTLVGLLQRTLGLESYSENNSVGYYLQEQVGWNDRLFVTGALRADDHSSFGSDFDVIVYPKFSVSYIASEEPAIRRFTDMARMTSLQLRAAWGQAGTAPNAYAADQTYTVDRVTLGSTTGSALRTAAFGNPNLKPEKGTEIEVGFVAGFLRDRLSADVTYYSKRTDDMLQSIPVAASTGFLGSRLTNLGEVTNKGIEVSLNAVALQRGNLTWESNVSYATNANKLISFSVKDKILETPGGQAYGVVQQHRPGYPLGGFWVIPPLRCGIDVAPATGVRPCPTGEVGTPMLTTAGAAVFNTGDTARRYFGTSMPTRTIGVSNTVRLFKYARVYALLDHQGGHKVFNLQERNRCQAANDNCARVMELAMRIPQGTTSADSIKFKELQVYRSTAGISPEWIENGSFWKLREVSLSLDAPERFASRARAQSASLVLSGRNLAVWSPYSGVDPEVNSYGGRNFVRVDAYASPMMRRLSAMINLVY
jgi:TonB-dependent starch-binding outer membrane protein SusC